MGASDRRYFSKVWLKEVARTLGAGKDRAQFAVGHQAGTGVLDESRGGAVVHARANVERRVAHDYVKGCSPVGAPSVSRTSASSPLAFSVRPVVSTAA